MLHGGEERRVGEALGRGGLHGLEVAAEYWQLHPGLKVLRDARDVLVAPFFLGRRRAAQLFPASFELKRRGRTVGLVVDDDVEAGLFQHTVGRHSGEQRLADHARDEGVVTLEALHARGGQAGCGEKRAMTLDLRVVDDFRRVVRHAPKRLRRVYTHMLGGAHQADKLLETLAVLGVHKARVGARVGDESSLVKALQGPVACVGTHAEALAGKLLGAGRVEQGGGALRRLLPLDASNRRTRLFGGIESGLRFFLRGTGLAEDDEAFSQIERHAVRFGRRERLDGAVARHHEGQRGRAHASHALR